MDESILEIYRKQDAKNKRVPDMIEKAFTRERLLIVSYR